MLTRRRFVESVSLLAIAGCAIKVPTRRRPNILLLLADDWGWPTAEAVDLLGCRVPTFDRIRSEGAEFTNAHVAAPSCTPSRASILTGRPPFQLEEGAYLNGTLPTKFPVYPELIEAAGYHTGFSGKGWGPGDLQAGGRTRNPAGKSYSSFDDFWRARPSGRPFCFWLGSNDPHRPFTEGEGRANGHVIPPGRLPPYLPDVPEVREDAADYVSRVERFDQMAGEIVAKLEAAGELDNTLVVMTGDNGWAFPRAKATLYDGGTHVPFAMRLPGRVVRGSRSNVPILLTDLFPTFLEVAGVTNPLGKASQSLFSRTARQARSTDRIITCLERHMDGREMAGQAYPARALRTGKWLYIRNIHPEREPVGKAKLYDPSRLRTFVYAGYPDIDASPTKEFIVQHATEPAFRRFFEMAVGKRPPQELYDVEADPANMVNLAGDSRHRNVLRQLDKELTDQLTLERDPRILGTDAFLDTLPSFILEAKPVPGSEQFTRPLDY